MKKEFRAMEEQAKRIRAEIRQISSDLDAKWQTLRQIVDEYNAKRVEILFEKFRSQKKAWCTLCATYFRNHTRYLTIYPEAETELLFIEDKHMAGGDHYSSPEPVFYSNLHRACLKCCEKALDRHGARGSNWFFHAFRDEQREDGYYAREFDEWVKLDDEKCQFLEFPDSLIEPLAEELSKKFKLPPGIEIKSEELVIHGNP